MVDVQPKFSTCRLCGQHATLVKSHVIPEAFFRHLRGDEATLLMVSPQRYPGRAPIGVYERMLCETCEGRFGGLDAYGCEVLLRRFGELFVPVLRNGQVAGYEAAGIDKLQLLRFLVSVTWRASVASHGFYQHITLGPLQEPAARFALDGDADTKGLFDAVLARWQNLPEIIKAPPIFDPRTQRIDGVNTLHFYLGPIEVRVKVDARRWPPTLARGGLRAPGSAMVVARDLERSKDWQAMKWTVNESRRPGRG
jgi:hypothetical protein